MAPPPNIIEWLNKNYPKPKIDPEWLQGCYDWIISDKHLDPNTDMQKIIQEVEIQLLESDLRDSMLHGTGIPGAMTDLNAAHSTLTGPPILVQIESITDIGVSAHNLNKTRQTREERKAAGEDEEGEGDDDVEGEGPIPNYTRSMLRLEISDGATTLRAMEYRPIPELVLGQTPLGYKMLIQNAEVRRGIIFLEPRTITLKGHLIADREVNRESEFARSLRLRLGLPEPDATEQQEPSQPAAPAPQENPRSPLREIPAPPSPTLLDTAHTHSDDEDQPRRRRIPNKDPSLNPTPSGSTASTLVSSFSDQTNPHAGPSTSSEPRKSTTRSPVLSSTIIIDSDEEDGDTQWLANSRSRPIKPIPSRARKSTETDGSRESNQAKERPLFAPDDADEFDDTSFEELDSAFLEGIAQAEMEAVEGSMRSLTAPSAVVATDSGVGSQPGNTSTPTVITIEDDDEDDKENVPVPTRHVRARRTGRPVVLTTNPEDVINISD